mgnify:CR=1 FL=1
MVQSQRYAELGTVAQHDTTEEMCRRRDILFTKDSGGILGGAEFYRVVDVLIGRVEPPDYFPKLS